MHDAGFLRSKNTLLGDKENTTPRKEDKDYKTMFQLLLEEKKRQVKNTKELLSKIHGLTDELQTLKSKNKQLSTVINRFGNVESQFESGGKDAAAHQNSARGKHKQGSKFNDFMQSEYDELLKETIYKKSNSKNKRQNSNMKQSKSSNAGESGNLSHRSGAGAKKSKMNLK